MGIIRIFPILTGHVCINSNQRVGRGNRLARPWQVLTDAERTPRLPILAWLIDHPDGLIVADTGETSRAARPGSFPRRHPCYRRANEVRIDVDEEIGPRLTAVGVPPRDVRTVVLTHPHTDHAGGLAHFRRSASWSMTGKSGRRMGGRAGCEDTCPIGGQPALPRRPSRTSRDRSAPSPIVTRSPLTAAWRSSPHPVRHRRTCRFWCRATPRTSCSPEIPHDAQHDLFAGVADRVSPVPSVAPTTPTDRGGGSATILPVSSEIGSGCAASRTPPRAACARYSPARQPPGE